MFLSVMADIKYIIDREQELMGNEPDSKSHHSPECYVITGHGHSKMMWPCISIPVPQQKVLHPHQCRIKLHDQWSVTVIPIFPN